MRIKIFLFALIYLLTSFWMSAQDCPVNLYITSEQALLDFQTEYPNCVDIPGDVTIKNSNIKNLIPFSNLESIGGTFILDENDSLQTLEGLQNLSFVGRTLEIREHINLLNLDHLESIDSIGNSLRILYNDKIENINVFKNIKYLSKQLDVNHNDNLESLNGLHNLISTGDHFAVQGNNRLKNLEGLNSFEYSYDGISMLSGDSIQSLTGLENLKSAYGLWLFSMPIIDLVGLENLEDVVDFDFVISGCDSLTSIQGLSSLVVVNSGISISNCSKLKNVDPLYQLTSIGEELSLIGNSSLENIDAFLNLTFIGDDLIIRNNDKLKNLYGLRNVNPSAITDLWIIDNDSLDYCAVQSVCDYLELGNPYDIYGNKTDCNSKEEIELLCQNVATVNLEENQILIYPNPSSNKIFIETDLNLKYTHSKIYDISGKIVFSSFDLDDAIDVTNFPSGVYCLSIDGKHGSLVQRFVKE